MYEYVLYTEGLSIPASCSRSVLKTPDSKCRYQIKVKGLAKHLSNWFHGALQRTGSAFTTDTGNAQKMTSWSLRLIEGSCDQDFNILICSYKKFPVWIL